MDSLIGISLKQWMKVLAENNFRVHPSFFAKTVFVTAYASKNYFQAAKEFKLFDQRVRSTELIKQPIFILGHWRSGTTFLHNLLSKDRQFAFPCLFDIRNPDTFLQKEDLFQKRLQLYSANKRMMDNVQVALDDPAEEEFAIAIQSLMSPLIGWMFPSRGNYYEKYSTFKNVAEDDIQSWRQAYQYYLKKLTVKYNKQLLLKSPLNTGRIGQLIAMYPDAKFIHIHRNPYDVFRSTRQMYKTAVRASRFQNHDFENLEELIIKRYETMYKSLFENISKISDGHLCEIGFEKLESDPKSTIKLIYQTLGLEFSGAFEQVLDAYLASQRNYKKNVYSPLDVTIKKEIETNWNFCFEKWKYDL